MDTVPRTCSSRSKGWAVQPSSCRHRLWCLRAWQLPSESRLKSSGGGIPRQAEADQVHELDGPAPKQLRQSILQAGGLDFKVGQGGQGPSRQARQFTCNIYIYVCIFLLAEEEKATRDSCECTCKMLGLGLL